MTYRSTPPVRRMIAGARHSSALPPVPSTPLCLTLPPVFGPLQDPDSQFSRLLASERRQSSLLDSVDADTSDAPQDSDHQELHGLVGVPGGGRGVVADSHGDTGNGAAGAGTGTGG